MSKYKRVWAILGVVGMLSALMALSVASPSPAGADVGPDNTITITKLIQGTPDGNNVFGLAVFCADPDNSVVEDPATQGGDTSRDWEDGANVNTNGQSVTFSIPAWYLNCSFFELNTQGANRSIVQATSSTAPATTITILDGTHATNTSANFATFAAGGGQTVQAFIANVYNANTNGTVRITKRTVGAVPAGAFWQMRVTCLEDTLNYEPGNPNRVVPARVVDAVFLAAGTQDVLIPTTNSESVNKNCTPLVDENIISPAGSAVDTYDPAAANTTGLNTILGGATTDNVRLVTVTNTFAGPTNRITVTKTVVGTPPAGTQHTIDVRCVSSTGSPQGVYSLPLYAMNAGETHVFETPAAYDICAVQETSHAWQGNADKNPDSIGVVTFPVQGAVIASFAGTANNSGCPTQPNPPNGFGPAFDIGAPGRSCSLFAFANRAGGNTAAVGITNRYIAGPYHTITVNKATTGTVPAGTVFVVEVECDSDITPGVDTVYMAFGPGLPETQSVNWPIFNSPGDDCRVRELNSGGAVSRTFASGPSSGGTLLEVWQDPVGRVDIWWGPAGATTALNAQVNIVNRFNPKTLPDNTLRIKKQLRGQASSGPFTIEVRCSGGGITDTRILNFSTNSFQEITVPALRSDCRVVETANGGAQSVSYFASSATADATDGPLSARVNFGTVTGGQRGKVIVRNQFPGTCPRPGPKFC